MNVTCNDLERILERQQAAEIAALEEHAAACEACRVQLALEREITSAAHGMQRAWETPELWPRIRERLAAEPRPDESRGKLWLILENLGFNWRMATATASLAVLATVSAWLVLGHKPTPSPPGSDTGSAPGVVSAPDSQQRLLTEEAMKEVERTEAAYIQSIERLSALAAARLQKADTPLLANYREKLLVLDSAIAECRTQLEQNRFNAHLRSELLSIYQMKQATLTDVLREESR